MADQKISQLTALAAADVAAADVLPIVDTSAGVTKKVTAASMAEFASTSRGAVEQSDLGSAPNEVPLNQYLGDLAYMNAEAVVIQPQASVTPGGIGDMVFQLTSDTSLTIKVKGSDGTVRSVALTLA